MTIPEQLFDTNEGTTRTITESSTDAWRIRRLPLLVCLAVLLTGGIAGVILSAGQSSEWLGAWGFRLTFWGLIVSIVGFLFTIWQLVRTQSAAMAGAEALHRLRRDFRSLDVIIEIGSARDAVQSAKVSLGESDWRASLASYDKIRSSVDKSIAAETGLLSGEVDSLKDYQAHFMGVYEAIESLIRQDSTSVDTKLFGSRLREFESFLTQLEYKIRDRFGAK